MSKGLTKIKIDGGCTYDFIKHIVIHNSGPFTDDGCLHTKWQDEKALANRVREEYAVEIEQAKACLSVKEILAKLEKRLDDIGKKIPDDLEKRLDKLGDQLDKIEQATRFGKSHL